MFSLENQAFRVFLLSFLRCVRLSIINKVGGKCNWLTCVENHASETIPIKTRKPITYKKSSPMPSINDIVLV